MVLLALINNNIASVAKLKILRSNAISANSANIAISADVCK